jgi:hypothetical protein
LGYLGVVPLWKKFELTPPLTTFQEQKFPTIADHSHRDYGGKPVVIRFCRW